MPFEGRVAVVTGAGRGIGKAIATAFVREKAHVIMVDIGPEKEMRSAAKELSCGSVEVIPMVVDVSRYDQVRKMTAEIEASFQRLDILVNNAGIIRRGSIETVTEQEWDDVIGVNLKGTFNCCKAAAEIMIRQRSGKIVNVSSVAAKIGDITSAPG